MATNNARVWDADNQDRPEEPNAVACTSYDRPVTCDHNPRWNAMDTAHSVAEDIWRNVLDCESKGFDLTVEMPDGSVWIVPIEVQYEPTLCRALPSRGRRGSRRVSRGPSACSARAGRIQLGAVDESVMLLVHGTLDRRPGRRGYQHDLVEWVEQEIAARKAGAA